MMIPYKINFTLLEFLAFLFNGFREVYIKDTIPTYNENRNDSRAWIKSYCDVVGYDKILLAIIDEFYQGTNYNIIASYSPSILKVENSDLVLTDNRLNDVVALFINRNWDNYIFTYKAHKKYEDIEEYDLRESASRIINNILSILEMTQDRYLKLLDMYQATTTDLLAKLQRSSSGSADNKTFTNLTPQTPATNTEDWFDYVNNAVKNLSSASETTSEDRDYLIDKINAIQEKYRNILKDWAKELDRLCWESD